jgi:hypothetical protein
MARLGLAQLALFRLGKFRLEFARAGMDRLG